MKKRGIGLVACLTVVFMVSSPALGDTPLNWASNLRSSTCVGEFVTSSGFFAGSLRLFSCTSGFGEGEITLPSRGTWNIALQIGTDESLTRDPNDSVEVFINGSSRGTFLNTPHAVFHLVTATVEGDSFTYRFDFSSGNSTDHLHMIVAAGVAFEPTNRCDADGDGAVTVSDGVNALRAAAGLTSLCD